MHAPDIRVNAEVEDGGEVRLEMLDHQGRVIPGFERERCLPIRGDGTGQAVRWEGQPNGTELVGRPVRWRLTARQAKVYSVWMPDGEGVTCYHRFRSI